MREKLVVDFHFIFGMLESKIGEQKQLTNFIN
jgi:hypothetical protein